MFIALYKRSARAQVENLVYCCKSMLYFIKKRFIAGLICFSPFICPCLHAQSCDDQHKNAKTAISEGKLTEAKLMLDSAILECPHPAYYTTRGLLCYRLSAYTQAIENYTQAIAIKPTAELYYLRATAYYWADQKEKAQQDYQKTIILENTHAEAYTGLGVLAEEKEQWKQAFEHYNRAIKAKPTQALAYHNRGLLYYNQGNTKKALVDWDKALTIQTEYAEVRLLRAELFLEKKQYPQALQDLDMLISQKPYLSDAYLRRGEVYQAQKNTQKACDDWKKASALGSIEVEKLLKQFGCVQ